MNNNWSIKLVSLLFIFGLLLFLPFSTVRAATIFTSATSGNWDNPVTWGNPPGGAVPDPTNLDVVIIDTGDTVTLVADTIVGGSLTINSGGTLATADHKLTLYDNFIRNGTLNAGSSDIELTVGTNQSIAGFTTTGAVLMTKSGGSTATFTGNVSAAGLTINGSGGTLNLGAGLTHTITTTWVRTAGTLNGGSSTLNFTGSSVTGTGAAFVAGTGTVNYNAGGNQTISPMTYNNLTLSGSGTKTIATSTTVTVNSILSMQGTAVLSGSGLVYGPSATLKYDTASPHTVGPEWKTPFTATGGVFVTNTGLVTLSANRTLNASVPLHVDAGAKLAIGGYVLSLGGDLIQDGTLTLTSTQITLIGTADQSIDGFTTTDTVTMAKTGGRATFMENVTAGPLTINGLGGTLNLGSGTHTFSGTWAMTAGTLEGGSSILNVTGSESGTGATFLAQTGTVNYMGSGGQNVGGLTYNHLGLSGGSTKSTTGAVTVNGNLTVAAGTTLQVQGYNITVTGTTTVNGTLTYNNINGIKLYAGPVIINGSWSNSSGNADIHFRGGLTYNGTSFTSGTGTYIFETNSQSFGGTSALALNKVAVNGVVLTNNGSLTVNTDITGSGGSLVQGADATFNIAGTISLPFTSSALGNTVIYGDTLNQSVLAQTYHHLSTGGTGVKTTAGNITVNGNLLVASGTNFTVTGVTFTVAGATTVDGILTHTSSTGTKTYGGMVTINASDDWVNSGNSNIHFGGGLTYNGDVFTPGTGIYYFESHDQSIGGSSPIIMANVVVTTITLTNTGTLTVSTALSGTGTLEQGAGSTLNISGTAAVGLNASIDSNTVNYNGAVQTVIPTTYHHLLLGGSGVKNLTGLPAVNGNLTMSGSAAANTTANLTIGGDLTLNGTSALTVGGFDFIVDGATSLNNSAIFTLASAGGVKTFSGNVSIGSGATWFDNAAAIPVTFGGDFVNNGTLFAGGGVHTFTGPGNVFGGSITIPGITITGSYTNNATLTAATSLDGAGTLTQGTSNPTLNIGGDLTLTTLDADANSNTVRYSKNGTQTIRSLTYHHLATSGAATKTLGGAVTVNGDLTIGAGTILDVSASDYAINLYGDWVNSVGASGFEAQAGTVFFLGSAAQDLTGATAFNNLTVNNSAGITLAAANQTVNGVLTLTSGKVSTGTRTLILGTAATVSGADSPRYINGNLQKNYLTGSQSFTYPIGDADNYTPLTLTFANITSSTNGGVTARSFAGEHPNIATSGLDLSLDVNRNWTLTLAGTLTFTTYDVVFNFMEGDKDPGTNFNNFIVKRNISPTSWGTATTGTKTSTSTQATGLSLMGSFAIGQPDLTPSVVTNVSSTKADGAYSVGELIPVRVTFNELVLVTGTPQLTLHTAGSANRVVNFSTGSGTNTLTFNYTVQAGDTSSDLDYLATNSLALNSGTIRDYGTNNANLDLFTPGQPGSLAANNAIVIDTTAPDTSIIGQPNNPDSDPTPTFTFSGTDGTGSGIREFMCKFDSASYGTCTNPYTPAVALDDGSHTMYVFAVDNAGNADDVSPATYTWTLDATPPETSISGRPTDPSNDNTPSFTFSGNDAGVGVASFMCKMDAGSYSACTSPKNWTTLPDGSHTFYVYAIDNLGNADDQSPATYTWLQDTVPPQTAFTSTPPSLDNDRTPEFAFIGDDGSGSGMASYMCKIDTGGFNPCISPFPVSTLSEGPHTFQVYGIDRAGNPDGTPASFPWTIDVTAPTTTLTGKPNNPDNDTTPTFTFTGSDSNGIKQFMCKMDSGTYSVCTSGVTWSVLSAGQHTFYVYAVDNANNADLTPVIYTWVIQAQTRVFLPVIMRP